MVAGASNNALGPYSFVGAGQSNQAGLATGKGITPKAGMFVGAGANNASDGNDSFVGAGLQNQSVGDYSFVGAGYLNTAGAEYRVVAGGDSDLLIS